MHPDECAIGVPHSGQGSRYADILATFGRASGDFATVSVLSDSFGATDMAGILGFSGWITEYTPKVGAMSNPQPLLGTVMLFLLTVWTSTSSP